MHALAEKVLQGDVRATARLLRCLDDRVGGWAEALTDLHPHTGRAWVVGITGNPGAGKSTLTDQLLAFYRRAGQRVGVLAADGRLLVFGLDELKRQSGGGRGLMLLADTHAKQPLLAAVSFGDGLRVTGTGRGGKPRDELLKGAALEHHVGKRARKGRVVAGFKPCALDAG